MAHVNEHLPSAQPAKSPSPTSNERGFTLVESLIAMVILTIGLVSLAELLAVSLRMQQLGRNETAAIRLAQDKLDQLSVLDFATVTVLVGGSLTANSPNHFDTPVDSDGNALPYIRRWVIANGPDGLSTRMRQITIRVIPTNPDARTTGTFEMISIIRKI